MSRSTTFRARSRRAAAFGYELTQIPVSRKKEIRTIGVGTALVESDVGKKLAVIVIAEAGPGIVLKLCE